MSKHKAIPKRIRQQLYEKYNHRCAYCGCNLEYKDMQVDHVKPVYVHNDIGHDMTESEMYDISNLLPPVGSAISIRTHFPWKHSEAG